MAKFHLAQQPYYLAVMIFMAISGLFAWFENDAVTGSLSDAYLFGSFLMFGTAAWAAAYFYQTISTKDDEGIEIEGLPAGKVWFYLLVGLTAAYHFIDGWLTNRSTTGFASEYGKIWFFASGAILLFTWANWRSYAAAHPDALPKVSFGSPTQPEKKKGI
jgi:hypothetical protein